MWGEGEGLEMKRFAAWGLTLVFVMGVLAGCVGPVVKEASSKPGEEIVIGMAMDLSAGTASYGLAAQQAAQLAVDEFNKAGGYNGQAVKLVIYDDTANPQKSVELITRLIHQDKAIALVGPANSGNANQHIEIVQKAEIPEVIPVATAAAITLKYQDEPKNYIFRISMVDSAQVLTMLRYAKEKGYTKIGVLHDTTGYGTFGVDEVKKQAASFGVEVVSTASFQVGDTNLEPQLNKMRDANVDMVIIYCLAPEVAQILKSADKINYAPVLMGSWATGDPLVKSLAGNLINKGNVFMIQSFTVDQSQAAKDFDKKMTDLYKDRYIFPIAAAQTYDSVGIILQALKKVGPDSKKIRDAIENMDDFVAITSAPKNPFTKDNHEALNGDVMFVGTWKDGQVIKAQ
jgi:branched-chain amino acid transport system substrate-binding protein